MKDFDEFCDNFNIIDNAMQMRTLIRWNGRDLRNKENLAEHTHLVTACALYLYDRLKYCTLNPIMFEKMIRRCMLHDSLELLRGDILSVTKDIVPGLRDFTDKEEDKFMQATMGNINQITKDLVTLADLMACYKFIEYELRFPSNDFAINVYHDVKEKFDEHYKKFISNYICNVEDIKPEPDYRYVKGYWDDAGIDIVLDKDATFMPMSTTTFGLNVKITPKEGDMAILCSRTSAAAKGLIVAMCPIDPNYNGEVMAIVHNISNKIITYKKGEAFCQAVTIPFVSTNCDDKIGVKKQGKRSDGKLGSTGN